MSRYAEKQLIAHLLDEDSIARLIKDGFQTKVIPSPELQDVYGFAIDYYLNGKMAPTEEVFDSHEVSAGRTIGNLLDDLEVDWRQGAETSLKWVIDDLKASYVSAESQKIMRAGAQSIAESDADGRLEAFSRFTSEAVSLMSVLQDRRTKVDATEAMESRMDAYEIRARHDVSGAGLTLGMPELDAYTGFIQPGELAMLAAFAKVGKSFMLDLIALKEWLRGNIPGLFTLENGIDMGLDRIACLATGVNATSWQRGECTPIEVERVMELIKQMQDTSHPFYLFSPDPGQRTPEAIVRLAQVSECNSVIIDQLSHMEYEGKAIKRNEQVSDILRKTRLLLSTGYTPLPGLMAHQINREGKKNADKRGYHEKEDLAETSEAERVVDWAFTMYQSHDMEIANRVLLQTLASRRVAIKWWDMSFRIEQGYVAIRNELTPFE